MVDTSALLALAIKGDRHHPRAVEFLKKQRADSFITSTFILDETATRLRALASARTAVDFVRAVLHSQRYTVVEVDSAILEQSLDRMVQWADQRLSLTDCSSFVVMDRLGVRNAFTFDSDFLRCGYQIYPS